MNASPALVPAISHPRGAVYRCDWLALAATLPDHMEGASLAIVDGPYNMGKAKWDKFKSWDHFRDWYRPHLEELGRILAESATVYLWGSDESEGELRPLMRSLGWTFKGSITWDKVTPPAALGWAGLGVWADQTESAGFWTRGAARTTHKTMDCGNVWRKHILGPAGLSGEIVRGRGLVRAKCASDGMIAAAAHPCQKPLLFAERMILASSRPGDTVIAPFGGTCREAVAVARLPEPDARRFLTTEIDQDGRDYIEAIRHQLEFVPKATGAQPSLFGAA